MKIKEVTGIPDKKINSMPSRLIDACARSRTGIIQVDYDVSTYSSVYQYIRRNGLQDKYSVYMRTPFIYIQRMEEVNR